MAKRSNLIVIIGLAVFVAGAAATFLIVRNDDSSGGTRNGTPVLYANQAIPSGTTGGNAVDQGLVKSRSVDLGSRPANALTDPSQLVGKTAVASVPEGAILTDDQFTVPQTRLGTLRIPDGKTALALQLGWVQGVGGFVGSGDRIDIFGVVKDGPGSPSAKLIMQNTEVLNVNVSGQTAAAGTPISGDTHPIFLLAVTPVEAERLVYLTSFQQLYFSLVSKDAPAVGPTPGSGAADALKQLS
ncbi:MAG TPA: Flp pilus assembly protein CpaB [Acidimicrobiales bacterium]|nr:Flp pilus assembly protein CpaB [Acidimicrobiales bacterium]